MFGKKKIYWLIKIKSQMSLKTAKNRLRECKALKKTVIVVDRGSKYIDLALANFEQNPVKMTPLTYNFFSQYSKY